MSTTEPVDTLETTGTRPRYDEYEDSGVEWLGEIPGHWKTVKLKYLTECLDNRRIPLNSEERGAMQGDIPYWGANGVVDHVDDWLFDEKIVLLGEDGAPFFEKNEPVSFLVDEKVWVNNHAHILKAGKRLLPEFLVHVLNTVDYGGFIGGSTRDKLNQSEMGNIWVQLPPLEEQRTIATFLDRETGRIDTLIEKKKRLIDLLEEKRTALISRVVTKGLDRDVEMQDSGVEWLGEIPGHWGVSRLKFLVNEAVAGPFGSSLTKSMYDEEGDYKVYGQEQVIPGDFSIGDYYIDESKFVEMERYSISPGDLLVSCVGTFGRTAVVPENCEPGIINPRLIRLAPDRSSGLSEYLQLYLGSDIASGQFEKISHGGTMGIINLSTLSELSVTVPPLNEQQEIVEYLDEQETRIDALVEKVEEAIGRLKEYRTALISAAVTGQIDVREEVATAPVE